MNTCVETEKIHYVQKWGFEYRGVWIEIKEYPLGDERAWAFYLHLALVQFPKDAEKLWLKPIVSKFGSMFYNYSGVLNLPWHHGCSYYEKVVNPDNGLRGVVFGCDYHHYWDEGREYIHTDLIYDAKQCVDALREQYPDFIERNKIWAIIKQQNPELYISNEGGK